MSGKKDSGAVSCWSVFALSILVSHLLFLSLFFQFLLVHHAWLYCFVSVSKPINWQEYKQTPLPDLIQECAGKEVKNEIQENEFNRKRLNSINT